MNQLKHIIPQESLHLPSALKEIILKIENLVGRAVIFRSDIQHNYEGASLIKDGAPTIYLSKEGRRSITICHELLHIECEIQGFPRTKTIKGNGQYQVGLIKFILEFLQATIEHQVIHPKMQKLGYDPYDDLEIKTRNGILANLNKNPYEKTDEENLNHHFCWLHDILRPLAELDNEDIHKEILTKTKNKCPKALYKAISIAEIIKKQPIWNQSICRETLNEAIKLSGIPKETYEIYP